MPHARKPHERSTPTQPSPVPPPSLQKAVKTFPYSQATLHQNALAQISPLHSPSFQVPGQASFFTECILGQPIAAHGVEEILLTSSGALGNKESHKQELRIFPSTQVPLESQYLLKAL